MTEKQKSVLLSKYEKIKGYSSDMFNNEEWSEFDSFCLGYILAKCEFQSELELTSKCFNEMNELLNKS